MSDGLTSEPAQRVAAGPMARDERHFDNLIGPLTEPAYRLALMILRDPSEAEDAVQEAALRAWRKLGQLRDEGTARPWFLDEGPPGREADPQGGGTLASRLRVGRPIVRTIEGNRPPPSATWARRKR